MKIIYKKPCVRPKLRRLCLEVSKIQFGHKCTKSLLFRIYTWVLRVGKIIIIVMNDSSWILYGLRYVLTKSYEDLRARKSLPTRTKLLRICCKDIKDDLKILIRLCSTKKNKLLFDEALEHFCSAKSIFNAHKLPSHVVLAALGISDLLDTRCRHLSSSPHTQIRENPIGLALASLVELTEARASLRATKEGGESRRAVASRLPDRAKTLLQIAMASNNTSIISYCKAIYQTVLTRDTQVEDMLDAAASAIHPLIELFDSTPSEDAEIEGTATQQESHVTSSISTTTNKKRKKKKKSTRIKYLSHLGASLEENIQPSSSLD
mmetsp:Transcript_24298/g.30407  ORF Transcript_24298/g.30407 Transcript_24298/m.30407 type:complete len:321 (-) Transcript_24298:1289-2251(-)